MIPSRLRYAVVALITSVLLSCAPVTTRVAPVAPALVDVQLLAFNDFHGNLEPASGANGQIEDMTVGGVEYLATHIARLRATNPNTIVVSAGDNIGASPFVSAMFHDEPTVEALNAVGLQISTVGNHEFDEGWWELYRMQKGGCHPTDGCQGSMPFRGAAFTYLSTNVMLDPAKADPAKLRTIGRTPASGASTLFPSSAIRTFAGVKIGFIGLVVHSTPDIVQPAATAGLTFRPEAEAANEEVARLTAQGVHTIIVLIHEGATPARDAYNGCEDVTGPVMGIARALSPEVDAVVAGHVHRAYNCTVGNMLVTSAASLGRVITDINLRIDARTGDVVSKSATNVLVTRDVPAAPAVTALIERYRPLAARVGSKVVGTVAAEIAREQNRSGEAPLGDVVADAMLEAARQGQTGPVDAAITNVGGIRAGLVGTLVNGVRTVSYSDAFEVLPFGNRVQVKTVTGDTLLRWLEQQFDNPNPGSLTILQVAGITYSFSMSRSPGQRINRASVMINGKPLEAVRRYRIVSSDFVWNGGDAFTVARDGTDPVDLGADVDVLVAYLRAHPNVPPGRVDRITREP